MLKQLEKQLEEKQGSQTLQWKEEKTRVNSGGTTQTIESTYQDSSSTSTNSNQDCNQSIKCVPMASESQEQLFPSLQPDHFSVLSLKLSKLDMQLRELQQSLDNESYIQLKSKLIAFKEARSQIHQSEQSSEENLLALFLQVQSLEDNMRQKRSQIRMKNWEEIRQQIEELLFRLKLIKEKLNTLRNNIEQGIEACRNVSLITGPIDAFAHNFKDNLMSTYHQVENQAYSLHQRIILREWDENFPIKQYLEEVCEVSNIIDKFNQSLQTDIDAFNSLKIFDMVLPLYQKSMIKETAIKRRSQSPSNNKRQSARLRIASKSQVLVQRRLCDEQSKGISRNEKSACFQEYKYKRTQLKYNLKRVGQMIAQLREQESKQYSINGIFQRSPHL